MNCTVTYTKEGLYLHPDALRAVALFVGHDDRQHLHNVFVDEEGHLAATCGHTLIRLLSIDPSPAAAVPKDWAGRRWDPEAVEAAIKSAPPIKGRGRVEQHAKLRVCLQWEWSLADESSKPPLITNLLALSRKGKPDGKPSCIATRYVRRLAEASELLIGKDAHGKEVTTKGPVLINNPGAMDPKLYGIPWHEPIASDPKITWVHGKTPESVRLLPAPEFSAEILIMPLRID